MKIKNKKAGNHSDVGSLVFICENHTSNILEILFLGMYFFRFQGYKFCSAKIRFLNEIKK
ncbi:hypothetical protein AP75_03055 [Kaistella haifensis DSM 19056]|uniref:Uncharacterized protein n=1 Tax=Kaistella haifensis DSM 19056 TaxID=1450526 RepID=A0A246BBR4_9FLAO|nr:hypothetical protein AP75_03055 [Kaistella haifensis DSM 19056]